MKMIDTPAFTSETEEAQWWFEHRDIVTRAFQEEYPLPSGKTPVDLLLDEQDAQLAEAQAVTEGLTREAYMVQLLHRALHERKAAPAIRL